MEKYLNIILVGSGSYVCGNNEKDFGTILPALFVFVQKFKLKINIIVASNSSIGSERISTKFKRLKFLMKVEEYVNLELIDCKGSPDIFFEKFSLKSSRVASIVSVPDQYHYYWIKKILLNKIPVLTVKPLTLNLKDSLELRDISKELNVPAFVEFHKRYDRQLRYSKDQYQSNELGDLLYTYTEYTQRKLIPTKTFKSWADKTNIFSYLGVHYVDAIYYITKAKPIKVMATGQKGYLLSKGLDYFDSIQCNITWETQQNMFFNQTIMCSWVESNLSSAMSSQNLNLIFSKGRINCEQKDRGLSILKDDSGLEHINPDFSRQYSEEKFITFEGYGIDAYINYLNFIVNKKLCINDNRICSFDEGCISTSVIDAANKSLNNNSNWINLNDLYKN